MTTEQPQQAIHFDPETILRMKYLGMSKADIAAYFGMRYADFIKKLHDYPILRELLK